MRGSVIVLVAVSAVWAAPASAFPYPLVASPAVPPTAYITRHHAQDELGQVNYGFTHPGQAKNEIRDAFGNVAGVYTYIDPDKQVVHVEYTAGHDGFQVRNDNQPLAYSTGASQPVTPEVTAIKLNSNDADNVVAVVLGDAAEVEAASEIDEVKPTDKAEEDVVISTQPGQISDEFSSLAIDFPQRVKDAPLAIERQDTQPATEDAQVLRPDTIAVGHAPEYIEVPETLSPEAALDESVSGVSAPFESTPGESAPFEGIPAESTPFEGSPAEGIPDVVSPLEGIPSEGAPAESAPFESVPAESAPFEDAPAEGIPGVSSLFEGAPDVSAPFEGAPAESAPFESVPAENALLEGAPAERVPSEGAPFEGTPAESAPLEGASVEVAPAEVAPAEVAPTEVAPTEVAPTEDTPNEDAPTEDAPTEDAPTEDAPTEDAPTEDAPTEDAPIEDAPTEGPPAEGPPAEGPPAEGPPAEGPPAEGTPAEGTPAEGTPAEDHPDVDPPVEYVPVEDFPVEYVPVESTPDVSAPFEGTPADGALIEGALVEGTPVEGVPDIGAAFEGVPFEGVPVEGVPVEGTLREVVEETVPEEPVFDSKVDQDPQVGAVPESAPEALGEGFEDTAPEDVQSVPQTIDPIRTPAIFEEPSTGHVPSPSADAGKLADSGTEIQSRDDVPAVRPSGIDGSLPLFSGYYYALDRAFSPPYTSTFPYRVYSINNPFLLSIGDISQAQSPFPYYRLIHHSNRNYVGHYAPRGIRYISV